MPKGQFDRRPGSPWWCSRMKGIRTPAEIAEARAAHAAGRPLPVREPEARKAKASAPLAANVNGDQLTPAAAEDLVDQVRRRATRFPAGRVPIRPWQDQLGLPAGRVPEGWL